MPIVRCPKCTLQLMLPDGAEGKTTRCGFCDHVFQVPVAEVLQTYREEAHQPHKPVEPSQPRRTRSGTKAAHGGGTWIVVAVALVMIIVIPAAAGLWAYFTFVPGATSADAQDNAEDAADVLDPRIQMYLPDGTTRLVAIRPARILDSKYGKALKQVADAYGYGIDPFFAWATLDLCEPHE